MRKRGDIRGRLCFILFCPVHSCTCLVSSLHVHGSRHGVLIRNTTITHTNKWTHTQTHDLGSHYVIIGNTHIYSSDPFSTNQRYFWCKFWFSFNHRFLLDLFPNCPSQTFWSHFYSLTKMSIDFCHFVFIPSEILFNYCLIFVGETISLLKITIKIVHQWN